MATNVVLIVIGAVIFLAGLVKLGRGPSGGFNFSNLGFSIGGTITQNNKGDNISPSEAKDAKTDWVGLIIASFGLLTALFGLIKG